MTNTVMGSRHMTAANGEKANKIRDAAEELHKLLFPNGTVVAGDESARLYAVARTQLEIACAMGVKAVSRDNT